jgi:hypothetical protein
MNTSRNGILSIKLFLISLLWSRYTYLVTLRSAEPTNLIDD